MDPSVQVLFSDPKVAGMIIVLAVVFVRQLFVDKSTEKQRIAEWEARQKQK